MAANDLFEAARAVREHAYAPYSSFAVGAALRTTGGAVFVGANVENVAYPQGACAEANAIGAMIAGGERRIVEVLVVAGGPSLIVPCGGCRQRLAEFSTPETRVHLANLAGIQETMTLSDLFPMGFTPAHLGSGTDDEPPSLAQRLHGLNQGQARIAVILGSGLGGLADALTAPTRIDYRDLPGFPRPTVEGHSGEAIGGTLAGVPLLCLKGRVHLYEGITAAAVNPMIRALKDAGIKLVILTNAAGGIREDLTPGNVVRITDHINMLGANPLTGPNDDAVGPRFLDLGEVYSSRLGDLLEAAAEAGGASLNRGVYLATPGPSFETPAEIRAFRAMGADLVGMSTVPEVISARHAGLQVLGLSVVTNRAAGLADESLTHDQTLAAAAAAADQIIGLLTRAIGALNDAL